MIFELYKQHLVEDDAELQKIMDECKSGRILCGECKEIACKKMEEFMKSFEEGINKARKNIDKLNFVKFQ
jgi:tryptophanyl-tRNA synthetase